MPRSYQRSIRFEDELKQNLEALPYGSITTLVNELLKLYFADPKLQKTIHLKDARYNNYVPQKLQPMSLPGVIVKDSPAAPTTAKPRARLDDFMPGL